MPFSLSGKTALVTGSARGIGRAIALKLSGAGASVMLNDIDREPLMETGSLIDRAGGAVKAMPGDLTSPEFPQKLVDATVSGFGSIDIIVNNAGYSWDNVIQKMTDEQFQAMLDIHLVAPFSSLARGVRLDSRGGETRERGRPAGHAQGGQYQFGVGYQRECGTDRVWGRQGWHQRYHEDFGEGVGPVQRYRELRCVRIH